ncbi:hypothetical protein GCM10010195_13450 [Kitasatospora griseola]|nr:hypothetical protein GCM10010195_13450 [Kitasatospora griseola]
MAADEGRLAGGLPVGYAPPVRCLHRLVVTFGADHPGAVTSGARVFYERLGFSPAEAAENGPEGGSRQVYRRAL